MDLLAVLQQTVLGADQHPEARLLQDEGVVVVGVAHGPAADVAAPILLLRVVDVAAVTVGPGLELVELLGLKRVHHR